MTDNKRFPEIMSGYPMSLPVDVWQCIATSYVWLDCSVYVSPDDPVFIDKERDFDHTAMLTEEQAKALSLIFLGNDSDKVYKYEECRRYLADKTAGIPFVIALFFRDHVRKEIGNRRDFSLSSYEHYSIEVHTHDNPYGRDLKIEITRRSIDTLRHSSSGLSIRINTDGVWEVKAHNIRDIGLEWLCNALGDKEIHTLNMCALREEEIYTRTEFLNECGLYGLSQELLKRAGKGKNWSVLDR